MNWTLDFVFFTNAAEHWIFLLSGRCAWWHLAYFDFGKDRGSRLFILPQPMEDGRFRGFTLSHPAKHRRTGKVLVRCWWLQPAEHRRFWVGLSIFTHIGCDILCEGLLVLMSSRNPYRLGQYLVKANFRHSNTAPLTIYDPFSRC